MKRQFLSQLLKEDGIINRQEGVGEVVKIDLEDDMITKLHGGR